ncbi:hypothetical protein [Phocaeicola sp.]
MHYSQGRDRWFGRIQSHSCQAKVSMHCRGALNAPDNIPKVYLWMHYSQGRDRWFGRIQSAPTVGGNVIYCLSLTAMGFNPPLR